MSVPLYPVLCSCVLLLCWVLCAWEEVTARWSQWRSSPEILKSPAHQVCGCLLQEEMCLHHSSSEILWAAHGFSPKHKIFSVLLSPIPPTCTEPKTNWGTVFGLRALKCSVLLPLQNITSDVGCVSSGATRAELCVCVLCQELISSSACALCTCGCEGGDVCVCVSKVGCLNALLHYVNSSAVQSNSCRN